MGAGKDVKTSTPDTRALAGMAQRLEGETRPVRQETLNQILALLSGGINAFGPSISGQAPPTGAGPGGAGAVPGPMEPRMLTRSDLTSAYGLFDQEKAIDVNRITKGLGDTFTLDQLRSGANLRGLSGRSQSAFNSVLGELESLSKSSGGSMGGVTGGSGGASSFLPLITPALEQSRQATSRSLRSLEENFAGSKIGGTPFAERILADTRIQGEQATSRIPQDVLMQVLTQFVPLAFGQSAPAISGLSNAAAVSGGLQQQANAAAGMNSFGGLAQAFAQLGAQIGSQSVQKCWVAAHFFGEHSLDFYLTRWWVFGCWTGLRAQIFQRAYLRCGERLAGQMERRTLLGKVAEWVLRPVFEKFALRGHHAFRALLQIGQG